MWANWAIRSSAATMGCISLIFLVAAPARAITHNIPADFPTIQAGIDAAASGDTILVAPGTYSGAGNTGLSFLAKELVLKSSGGELSTEILGPGDGLAIVGGQSPASVFEGFTLRELEEPLLVGDSSPTLRNLRFVDNEHGAIYDHGYGGGINFWGTCTSTVTDCAFDGNSASSGGAVSCRSGASPIFSDVTFTGNTAIYGGAVECNTGASPTFIRCRFDGNRARKAYIDDQFHVPGYGGAVFCRLASPIFEDCIFWSNVAEVDDWTEYPGPSSGRGGAVHVDTPESQPAFSGCTFYGNTAEPWDGVLLGGTIHCLAGAHPVFERTIIAHSGDGGGIHCDDGGVVTLLCSNVFGNAGGNYLGTADPTGTNDVISESPLFCDAPNGDLTLHESSPCLAANNACGLQMGAYGQGCDFDYYTISGTILDQTDVPLPGATIDGGPEPASTRPDGLFSLVVPPGWSGTLAPRYPRIVFDPADRAYVDVQSDRTGQDFLATRQLVHLVPADFSNIQAAIDYAFEGDTVLVAPGTYNGAGNLNIQFRGKNLALIGEGGSAVTSINAIQANYPSFGGVFYFHEGESADALIQGFTMWSGQAHVAGGGIAIVGASPTLRDIFISTCESETGDGGALYIQNSNCTLENIVLKNCQARQGGGLCVRNSVVTATQVLVHDCWSTTGETGGVFCENSTVQFEEFSIVDNSHTALHVRGGETDLAASIVAFNTHDSAAIYVEGAETILNVACTDAFGNSGGNYGGEIADQTGINGNISADPVFCDRPNDGYEIDSSSPCMPANNSCGVLIGARGLGCDILTSVSDAAPAALTLLGNHPNPFNPSTTIQFGLPATASVELRIHDVSGRIVATLLSGATLPAGWHSAVWMGENDAGERVASGVYFSRLQVRGETQIGKMVLIK